MWELLLESLEEVLEHPGLVLIMSVVAFLGILYFIGGIAYFFFHKKELKPTPRPNRVPYDKDTFRK